MTLLLLFVALLAAAEPSDPLLDDIETAQALGDQAFALVRVGDQEQARSLYEQAIAMLERVVGPDDIALVPTLYNLGFLRYQQGHLADARLYMERVYSLRKAALDPDDPDVAFAMSNLAFIIAEQGDPIAARPLFEECLRIYEVQDPPMLDDVAGTLNHLAGIHKMQGDLLGALPLLQRSLAIREEVLSPGHLGLSESLNNVAFTLDALGDPASALELYERSLEIRVANYGEVHPAVALVLDNIASLFSNLDRDEEALDLFRRALEIREQTLGADHLKTAESVSNYGTALSKAGHNEEALPFYLRAVELFERNLGPNHRHTSTATMNLGGILRDLDRVDEARPHHASSLQVAHNRVGEWSDHLSEREALALVRANRLHLDNYLVSFDRPGDDEEAWAQVIRWKGGVARLVAERRASLAGAGRSPELADVFGDLEAVRAQISRLSFEPFAVDELDSRRSELDGLTVKKEDLERLLAQRSAGFRGQIARRKASPASICAALPADTALVDFLAYSRHQELQYLAFVLRSNDCRVVRVELGPAADIDEAVAGWRQGLFNAQLTVRVDGRGGRVAGYLWEPIAAAVGDAGRVILVPDGRLASVPFGALPVSGRYLIETRRVSLLESAADLVRWRSARADYGGEPLLIGDVDFGGIELASTEALRATRAPCQDRDLPSLPGTRSEVEGVAALWAKHHKGNPIPLTGAAATETRVVEEIVGRRVVHFATHGFFAGDSCRSALSNVGRGDQLFNPMVLSGIVLAGANDGTDEADGILTAEEVASLDLRGTELVVLSACETGLGAIATGEGVLGLRRAFATSGARTLVMSLWAVPDEATSMLMHDLYEGLLRRRSPLGPTDALREAQLAMIARNRSQYGDARPADWAAFTAAGDWR